VNREQFKILSNQLRTKKAKILKSTLEFGSISLTSKAMRRKPSRSFILAMTAVRSQNQLDSEFPNKMAATAKL
jgi:hypothetical protein